MAANNRAEWLRCRPWIEDALEYARGTHTIDDIEAGIEDGRFFFFSSEGSAVVVEFIDYPRLRVLNYFLIGGNLEQLVHRIEPAVTAWAKENGCRRVIGIGRKGLSRVFAKHGYEDGWTAIYKDI